MDNSNSDSEGPEPEVIQAELVEESPGTPWVWREVRPRRRWRLPALLFAATCLSTLLSGAEMADAGAEWLDMLLTGLRYSCPVMLILVCHETGHWLQARRYGVRASLPYFIPMPLSPLGTLGAVIAMEPRVGHRRALFDIGITGPLAGLAPAILFCIWGLHLSQPRPIPQDPHGWFVGSPLLFQALADWQCGPLPANYTIDLHPMAFAGWVGLLVTSLNLIPIGQLDGGHILYAILRQRAHKVASLLLFTALFLVFWNWERLGGWTLMIILLLIMGPSHPPTANDEEPLGLGRMVLGWLALAFIFVGFTPVPLQFLP